MNNRKTKVIDSKKKKIVSKLQNIFTIAIENHIHNIQIPIAIYLGYYNNDQVLSKVILFLTLILL